MPNSRNDKNVSYQFDSPSIAWEFVTRLKRKGIISGYPNLITNSVLVPQDYTEEADQAYVLVHGIKSLA